MFRQSAISGAAGMCIEFPAGYKILMTPQAVEGLVDAQVCNRDKRR